MSERRYVSPNGANRKEPALTTMSPGTYDLSAWSRPQPWDIVVLDWSIVSSFQSVVRGAYRNEQMAGRP